MRNHRGRRRPTRLHCEQLESRLALTGVVISEFLAANDSGLQDQDGDHSDWIELYNDTAAPVDLAGWRLTDDASDLSKWTLPEVTLPAGERLLVFASGKDRAIAGQELHASFALNADGEDLALVDPNGVVQDVYAPYPEQSSDVSYGVGSVSSQDEPLVDESHPVRVLAPTSASSAPGLTWTSPGYDDSAWLAGTSGVGYERSPGGATDYTPYIGADVDALMPSGRNTAYARFAFDVADVDELNGLTLRLRYDDGFVAYLNGQEVARANSPASPAWDSTATGQRSDSIVVEYEEFDLSGHLGELVDGANVLAIHGLNVNGSSDFLIDPLLLASRALDTGWVYMITPTPGEANAAGTLGFIDDTSVSVDGGFYDGPFEVLITTETADAEIRYTLDGSTPTATSGLVYNPATPPHITTTTVLRAAAFKPGFTPSNVETNTYLFIEDIIHQPQSPDGWPTNWGSWLYPHYEMSPDVVDDPLYHDRLIAGMQTLPSLSLVLDVDEFVGPSGIYSNPLESGFEWEAPVSAELIGADGELMFQIDAGLRVQGGASREPPKSPKHALSLRFRNEYGAGKLDFPLMEGSEVTTFDTLQLRAGFNNSWIHWAEDQRQRGQLIQDQWARDTMLAMGNTDGGHGFYVHVYVSGLYWGVYNLHERLVADHYAQYFGGDKEDYDAVNGATLNDGTWDAWDEMQAIVASKNWSEIQQVVDIDNFIDFTIVHRYAGNQDLKLDGNWRAVGGGPDRAPWRFYLWDVERILESPTQVNTTPTTDPTGLWNHLSTVDEFRVRFADRVQMHFFNGGALTPENAAARYAARADELDLAIIAESARWGSYRRDVAPSNTSQFHYTRDIHWINEQTRVLNDYFPVRTSNILNTFRNQGIFPSLDAPLMSRYGGTVEAGYPLRLSKPAGSPGTATIYYTLDGSDPRQPGGAIAPGAVLYTGPIEINSSTRVRTRVLDAGTWSAEVNKLFELDVPLPLRIVELNYHPAETEDHEFIEVLNTGDQTISLDGVSIAGFAEEPYVFPSGLSLAPGERIVVARNPAEFDLHYGGGVNRAATGYADANLSNGGEQLRLLDSFDRVLQEFTYSDDAPWPTAVDGDGYTLVYAGPLDADADDPTQTTGDPYDDAANWRASAVVGGTPGSAEPEILGDYNGDLVVDSADYNLWRSTYGSTTDLRADGDANGVVNAADYTIWRDNLTPPPAAVAAAETVRPQLAAEPISDPVPSTDDAFAVGDAAGRSPIGVPLTPWSPDSRVGVDLSAPSDGASQDAVAQPSHEDLLLLLALDRTRPAKPVPSRPAEAERADAGESDQTHASPEAVVARPVGRS